MSRNLQVTNATGSGAISTSYSATSGNQALEMISLHLSAAPTSAGSLIVTLNSVNGAEYDAVLLSVSLVGVTDLVLTAADMPMPRMQAGDAIDVAYANPDSRTYGLLITVDPEPLR